MLAFVAARTRCIRDVVVDLLGCLRTAGQLAVPGVVAHSRSIPIASTTVDEHAISVGGSSILPGCTLGVEEMHIGRLEHVVVHLVEVCDGADDVGADMTLAGEGLEASPDTHVRVDLAARIRGLVLLVDVDPLLDLDLTRAVVDLEGDVGGLRLDVADLADECDLCDNGAVDLEICT